MSNESKTQTAIELCNELNLMVDIDQPSNWVKDNPGLAVDLLDAVQRLSAVIRAELEVIHEQAGPITGEQSGVVFDWPQPAILM